MTDADFSSLIGCHGNVHWEIEKAKWGELALTSTNPEILVKIGPLDSELPGLERRPLKKIKN